MQIFKNKINKTSKYLVVAYFDRKIQKEKKFDISPLSTIKESLHIDVR